MYCTLSCMDMATGRSEIYAHTHPYVDVHCVEGDHDECPQWHYAEVKQWTENFDLRAEFRKATKNVAYKSEEWETAYEDFMEDWREWRALGEPFIAYKVWTCTCSCHRYQPRWNYFNWQYANFHWTKGADGGNYSDGRSITYNFPEPPRPHSWLSNASKGLQMRHKMELDEWLAWKGIDTIDFAD